MFYGIHNRTHFGKDTTTFVTNFEIKYLVKFTYKNEFQNKKFKVCVSKVYFKNLNASVFWNN